MPFICSVPNCKGNYRNGPRVSVFKFPEDEALKKAWLRNIHRDDFQPTKSSRVCELHFKSSDIEWETSAFDEKSGKTVTCKLKNPRLNHDAVPSIMPNCPAYLSVPSTSREKPDDRRIRLEQNALQQALQDSIEETEKYNSERSFSDLHELKSKLSLIDHKDFWSVIHKDGKIIFALVESDTAPAISYSVVIDETLKTSAFVGNIMLKRLNDVGHLPANITDINKLNSVMNQVQSLAKVDEKSPDVGKVIDLVQNLLHSVKDSLPKAENIIWFICQQLTLMTMKKHSERYVAEFMVFASLLFSMAPHSYKFLRRTGYIILPHPNTVKNICLSGNLSPQAEQLESNFLKYIKYKCKMLTTSDKTVNLMMDEIHVKPYFDYKGGNIAGMAFNCAQAATSAYVFMINSIMSPFKEVVHILPVKTITADILHKFIRKTITGLEEIGFSVLSVASDNNSINRKSMSLFAAKPEVSIVYPHPVNPSRPLFFVIDSVHLLKCYRNNWINQKNFDKCMFFPEFGKETYKVLTASFSTLRKLYDIEQNEILKFGYGLTRKALFPSNLERQNVKLVLKIFNIFVVEGLRKLGEKHDLPHYKGTAEFITTIIRWWSVVNVRTPFTGIRLNDDFKKPLTASPDDKNYIFLSTFLDWLDTWESCKFSSGTLTKETHSAAKLTTHALLEIASYCSTELGMKYILPGKFQTDNLEARFSLYRQLAGAQYHVSMRQVFECESKLRMQSVLKLGLFSNKLGDISIMREEVQENWDELDSVTLKERFPVEINVTEDDISKVTDTLPVITYLAGYCVHAVIKRTKCDSCQSYLTIDKTIDIEEKYSLIKNLDRGKLQCPDISVVNAVMYNYVITQKLCGEMEGEFLKFPNQKHLCTIITMQILEEQELLGDFIMCSKGHSVEYVFKMIIWSSVNTLLNNYCKKLNDCISMPSEKKKRKLQTLTKK